MELQGLGMKNLARWVDTKNIVIKICLKTMRSDHLPQEVMANQDHGHPIKTNNYKPSYLGQIFMDLHKISSICSQT